MTPYAIRDRVCAICLALPEATTEGDRHLGFSVRDDGSHGLSTTTAATVASPSTAKRRQGRTPRSSERSPSGTSCRRIWRIGVGSAHGSTARRSPTPGSAPRKRASETDPRLVRLAHQRAAASGTNDSRQRRLPPVARASLPLPGSNRLDDGDPGRSLDYERQRRPTRPRYRIPSLGAFSLPLKDNTAADPGLSLPDACEHGQPVAPAPASHGCGGGSGTLWIWLIATARVGSRACRQ